MATNKPSAITKSQVVSTVVAESMLTTLDNPYNPFIQFDDWYAFDVAKGYNTSSYLARIANDSNDLSFIDQTMAMNAAIDEIVSLNVLGIYIKVTADNFKDRSEEVVFPIVTIRRGV